MYGKLRAGDFNGRQPHILLSKINIKKGLKALDKRVEIVYSYYYGSLCEEHKDRAEQGNSTNG